MSSLILDRQQHLCQLTISGRIREAVQSALELVDQHMAQGLHQEALDLCNWIQGIAPQNPAPRSRRLQIQVRLGERQQVVSEAISLARLLIDLGQGEAALAALQEAQQQQPDHVAILMELGETHLSLGQLKTAGNYFRHCAQLMQEVHDWEAALGAYRRLHVVDPKDEDVLLKLGQIYLAQGHWTLAEQSLRQVLRLNLNHQDALYTLAQVCRQKGAWRDCQLALQRLLSLRPEDDQIAAELEQIREQPPLTAHPCEEKTSSKRLLAPKQSAGPKINVKAPPRKEFAKPVFKRAKVEPVVHPLPVWTPPVLASSGPLAPPPPLEPCEDLSFFEVAEVEAPSWLAEEETLSEEVPVWLMQEDLSEPEWQPRLLEADQQMHLGLLEEARANYQWLIEQSPERPDLRRRLVEAWLWEGEVAEAVEVLWELFQLNADEEVLDTILALDPGHSLAALAKIERLEERHDRVAALEVRRSWVTQAEPCLQMRPHLLYCLTVAPTAQVLQQLVRLEPQVDAWREQHLSYLQGISRSQALLEWAYWNWQAGYGEKAQEILSRVPNGAVGPAWKVEFASLCELLVACGRALEVAEQLTSEQIASLDLFTQGQIYFKRGQWESAVAAFQQTRRDLPMSYLYLGRCFTQLGLTDLAIKQWVKGLEHADEQLAREYHYELGLAQLDQPQVALDWFVKCYEIDAVYREVGDWVARLRNRAA